MSHAARTATHGRITCSGCPTEWTATGAAHCGSCHQTFVGSSLFDRHRHARGEYGGCLDPATLLGPTGDRLMFFRDGMWRGPEASEETKAHWRALRTNDRRAQVVSTAGRAELGAGVT